MMSYFHKKPKTATEHAEVQEEPVLSEEDEAFLHRITSEAEDTPPPLPERPRGLPLAGETQDNHAQVALMTEPHNIPLPETPLTPSSGMAEVEDKKRGEASKDKGKAKEEKKFRWSFLRRDSRDSKRKDQEATGTDLQAIVDGLKSPNAKPNEDGVVTQVEAKKEEDEMTAVLEQLNLAAVNNRVFSLSNESQELLRKFTLVLKDLVNGVPTAYGDLESLLKNSENQLQNTYKRLPSFMQKLIEQLPTKFTGSLGPEILAAAAEKQTLKSAYLSTSAGLASKMGIKAAIPSLKELVTKPGAVIGLLKAIMNALKTRFPAFMGMNVLWSLALFVLLFIFWYCHKRGRETRLEKERLLTEAEAEALAARIAADGPAEGPFPRPHTTTAPEGASIEEVRSGMRLPVAESVEGRASYAPGGSLAQAEKEAKEKGKGKS